MPPAQSIGLYDSKIMSPLSDGTWYVHVRFKNSRGWSATVHYKIAIDTVPPLPFTVASVDGAATDNPTPTLKFVSSDGLSGLAGYIVKVDDNQILSSASSTFVLPAQTPGKKKITVSAVDNAGNVRQSTLDLNILPIAGPTVTAINKNVFTNDGNLTVSGTAAPQATILLNLKSDSGALVGNLKANVDSYGNWGTQFVGPFKTGTYFVEATAQDRRGAQSLPVQTPFFKIMEKPLLVIGNIAITQMQFFLGLIAVIVVAFFAGWLAYHLLRRQIERRAIIAERDAINVFSSVEQDVDKLLKVYSGKKIGAVEVENTKAALKSMKKKLDDAQTYVIEDIKQVGE